MTVATVQSLRPLSLGELLDQAIRLYRRNFAAFIGIIAIVQVPLTLLQLIGSAFSLSGLRNLASQPSSQASPSLFAPTFLAGLTISLISVLAYFILLQGFAPAALARAIAGNRLGQPIGILEAYRQIGPAWPRLLGAVLLLAAGFIGFSIWILVPCIGWVTGPGMLLFFFSTIWPLVAPIIVLENKGVLDSFRRAWDLARRRFWRVFGFILILYLFNLAIVTGPSLLVSSLLRAVMGSIANQSSQLLISAMVSSLITLIFSLLYLPLQITAIILMYFDLRVRTEGFDLALQSSLAAGEPAEINAIMSQAPAAQSGHLITGAEIGYFAILSIGFGLIYLILIFALAILGAAMAAPLM